eukprot:10264094-Alexandrium_andersonii.AAC.1
MADRQESAGSGFDPRLFTLSGRPRSDGTGGCHAAGSSPWAPVAAASPALADRADELGQAAD